MAKPRVPTAAERAEVATVALTRIASGEPFDETSRWLQPFSDCEFPFPGDVFVELAADALAVAGVTRANPVSLADAYERHLPAERTSQPVASLCAEIAARRGLRV